MIAVSQPTSAAEVFANAAAVRKRLFSPQAAPPARKEVKPVLFLVAPAEAPRAPIQQHDSHVAAYIEWKGNPPLGFLKLRCRERDVDYADIIGDNLSRIYSDPRSLLMADVKVQFPDISLSEMGRLFRRNHTSCMAALRKHGAIPRLGRTGVRPSDRHADRVHALLIEGKTYAEIGEIIGVSYTTVHTIMTERGWLGIKPRRTAGNHVDEIKAMFAAGQGLKEISTALGFSRSHITTFIRKQGWTR